MTEIELRNEAKRRYRIGDIVDQTTAYNGRGGCYTLKSKDISVDTNKDSRINVAISGIGIYNSIQNIWAEITNRVVINKPNNNIEIW